MKLFLKKIVIFVLPILILIIGIELYIRNTPNDYSYKSDFLSSKGFSIKTLVLGSSHAYYGINPIFIDSSFNASYVSQSLYFDYLILDKTIKDMPNLKNIVLAISPFSFTRKLNTLEEMWRKYNYYYYYDITPSTINKLDYKKYSILANIGMNKGAKLIWEAESNNRTLVKCNKFGWGINENDGVNMVDFKENAEESIKRRTSTGNDFSFGEYWSLKIIKLANKNKINIIFIETPKHDLYNEILPKSRYGKMLSILNGFIESYDNVFYYDSNLKLEGDLFFDSHHLNKKGSIVYSKNLSEHLNTIRSLK